MANFSFDPTQAIGWLPDVVRSWLPWQWRPSISNWLVWSIAFGAAGIVCLLLHVLLRDKPKVDWFFLKSGSPLALDRERSADGTPQYFVRGVQLNALNVSGHPLHQVFGKILLHRDQRELPLLIIADGQWVTTGEIDPIPPRAIFNLGSDFRSDGQHWPGFEKRLSPQQFLQDFGGFTALISIDGVEQAWSFSIDELRQGIEGFERREEELWLDNPKNRPPIRKRKAV
jgi:hypothetical protein